ncbi:T-cell activation inhibitor, mitochondrial isoform 2, partial [Daubentonia madagascariensis]
MFCHLRPVRRLCLEKVYSHWFIYSRALSGAEAVNALRPFYFAVHPDFFGQHPRERDDTRKIFQCSNDFSLC